MHAQARGFTLIELLTAILMVSILLAIAIPSFREMGQTNRVSATQNDLVTAMTVARSEALRRSSRVSVCTSTSGTACDGVANDWKTGWIAFTDEGTAGVVDGGDVVLQTWPAAQGDTTVNSDTPFVQYAPTGMLRPVGVHNFFVSYTNCAIGKTKQQVAVSALGSLTSTKVACP